MPMSNLPLETILKTAKDLDINIPDELLEKIFLIEEDFQFNNKERTAALKEIEQLVKNHLS